MEPSNEGTYIHANPAPRSRRGCCLGCFFKLMAGVLALAVVTGIILFAALVVFPPFGHERTARILLVGLDEPPRLGGTARRADSIILTAVRLDGSGSTMLSVPRDARVRVPGYRGHRKINAAYAMGEWALLKETLAKSATLEADLPYHVVFDSGTLAAVVDAAGGVQVDVPHAMNYDDNWGNLHIHLKKGPQRLNGEQAVGFLRWRKDNDGRQFGSDFDRADRQQQLVKALAEQLLTVQGIFRVDDVYRAFKKESIACNLNLRQMAVLAWRFKHLNAQTVPGETDMRGGISYVICDWQAGREIWQHAVR